MKLGIEQPEEAFPSIKQLAMNDDWKVREAAATCLVEISRKRRQEVVTEMTGWVENNDANIRRTSVEGLRVVARKDLQTVLPVLEKAKTDDNLYVKKSMANVLRNASRYDQKFVFAL